jgi:Flp pilus assembly protein TadG
MVMIVALFGMIATAVDVGQIVLVRSQLQVAADAAAMAGAARLGESRQAAIAAAKDAAARHFPATTPARLDDSDVEFGTWDGSARVFVPEATGGNAIRVTARRDDARAGPSGLVFGRALAAFPSSSSVRAVAAAHPRDIAFVISLSGSMNDDTEPCWATGEIDRLFGSQGQRAAGSAVMQQLYDDLGYGPFPGQTEWVGQPWGVAPDRYAYAELTKDGGRLSENQPDKYRIRQGDSEAVRKRKAYSAIIDRQLARLMPKARPPLDSTTHYAYWEKYLDYVLEPVTTADGRGTVPPSQDGDRITGFNNPNRNRFPEVSGAGVEAFRNRLGYITYVQFMLDHGRDLRPDGRTYVPISPHSPDCPRHVESTAGGELVFPPRAQPVHAVRRALVAAIQEVKERNARLDPGQGDWVSIVTFDTLTGGGPVLHQPLTCDYDAAMRACTTLDAVGDKAATAAIEAGLIAARQHVRPKSEGGQGRPDADKVVVVVTDTLPDLYVTGVSQLDAFVAENPRPEFYHNGFRAADAVLAQALQMRMKRFTVFPVGIGLGPRDDFVDRVARLAGTADERGQGLRCGLNPAEYEQQLTEALRKIVAACQVRLVQ